MLKSAIRAIQEENLDKPFPLKYSPDKMGREEKEMTKIFLPNYEGNAIWTQLGAVYIHLVNQVNKKHARAYIKRYRDHIEKNKNCLELFNPDGTVFKTLFYHADEGMLWYSIFLDTIRSKR